MIKLERSEVSRINGQKGGRPKQDSKIRIELPEIDLVILTPDQYGSLLEKYGYELLRKAYSRFSKDKEYEEDFNFRYLYSQFDSLSFELE